MSHLAAEIGPVAWNGGNFSPDLAKSASGVSIHAAQHRDPLADLLNTGGHLWHPENTATAEIAHARVLPPTLHPFSDFRTPR